MFHPWRRLRLRAEVELSWVVMDGRLGETDGRRLIRMHPHQTQVQRRCTLAHELAHIELGHVRGCDGRDERAARELAAGWLVPFEALVDAGRWASSLPELADELWVDLDTLAARLASLTPQEHASCQAAWRGEGV